MKRAWPDFHLYFYEMEKGETLCLDKLEKSYREVEKQLNLWKDTQRHSNELIQSLTSPMEQLRSCAKTSFERSPLCDFEGLKEKLEYKLLKQMEGIMEKIQDDLNIFKGVSDKVAKLCSSSLEVYEAHSSYLSMSVVCEGTCTQPSIADLLEGLCDLNRIHSGLYHDKIDILGRITYTAPMEIVYKAVREWTSTQDRNDYKIRDIMEPVAVFLASRSGS